MQGQEQEIRYFAEWGGSAWAKLISLALAYLCEDRGLAGAEVLDIGTRYGKMALLFASLGANVTGIDINGAALITATNDAQSWRAQHLASAPAEMGDVRFLVYDGSLDVFADESFDVIFTKSVLVLVGDLEPFLKTIAKKLKPGGRVVFLENGRGNRLLHSLRALRHRRWNYRSVRYFTQREAQLIGSIFVLERVEQTHLPPVYLFAGKKRLPPT